MQHRCLLEIRKKKGRGGPERQRFGRKDKLSGCGNCIERTNIPRVAPVMSTFCPASEKSCGAGRDGVGSITGDLWGGIATAACASAAIATAMESERRWRAWRGRDSLNIHVWAGRRWKEVMSETGRQRWKWAVWCGRQFPRIGCPARGLRYGMVSIDCLVRTA